MNRSTVAARSKHNCSKREATNLRVAIKVGFVATKDTKVMMDVIVAAAIIVIKAPTIGRIICDDKVMVYVIDGRDGRGGDTISNGGDVRQSVPRVECTVIRRFPTRVEEKAVGDDRAACIRGKRLIRCCTRPCPLGKALTVF